MSDVEAQGGGGFRTSWTRRVALAVLAAILILGFGLRIYRLGDECIWLDESVSYPFLHLPTLGEYLREVRAHDPPMSPLYFTLEYYWARIVGDSVTAVRLLSVALGLTSIVAIYLLGVALYNRQAGLIAALCTAMAIPHVYYAQEIRMYALVLFLALASMLFFVRALQTGRAHWWVLHGGCNALLLATHLFGALIIVVQGCYLLFLHAKQWRVWARWGAVHAVLFVPFVIRINHLRGGALDQAISLIPVPSLRWLLNTYSVYYAGLEPWGGRLPNGYGPVAVLLVVLATWAFWSFWRRSDHTAVIMDRRHAFVLLLLWFLLPPLILFALSFAMTPCFIERYTLYSSFALYLIVGGLLSAIRRLWWRVFILIAIGAGYAWAWRGVERPFRLDYHSVATVIDGTSGDGEPIVGWAEVSAGLLGPYLLSPSDTRFVHASTVEDVVGALSRVLNPGEYAWAVVYDGPAGDPRSDLESEMRRQGFRYHRTDVGGLRHLYVYHVTR